MTHITIKINKVTPEIQKTLDYLKTLLGVTISHSQNVKRAWDTASEE